MSVGGRLFGLHRGLKAAAKLKVLHLVDTVYRRSIDLLTAFPNYFQSPCVLEKRCIVCYLPFNLLRERERENVCII